MGRGRGKGKKLTLIAARDDHGSGEEEKIPTYRKRGRPQKTSKDDVEEDEDEAVKIEAEDEKNAKGSTTIKDLKNQSTAGNGTKKTRASQVNEKSERVEEENGVGSKPNGHDSVKSVGFRQSGSRRKSKPRRAAEAGVLCS